MPDYVKPHSSGTGWMYQKAVPKFLRPWLGTQFHAYISAANKSEAAKIAAPLAHRDDAVVRYLRNASDCERVAYAANGGLRGLRQRVASHAPAAEFLELSRPRTWLPAERAGEVAEIQS